MLLTLILIAAIGAICLTGAAQAGTVSLPQTGQTTSYATGDDGYYEAGVAWPNPRFTDNSIADSNNQTVTDNLTGLVWAKDANLPGTSKTWQEALDYVASMNSGPGTYGYTDWRLPNINELESLFNAGQATLSIYLKSIGFTNVQHNHYWSSTTYANDTSNAWLGLYVDYVNGNKTAPYYYVWPVRSGQSGAFGNSFVWKTGQTTTYATGDDGALQRGVAWPSPRFTDNGNQTVTDNLTGLIWAKDAGAPTVGSCTGGYMTWQSTLNYVACINTANYLGYTDWRLPNKKELFSLIDFKMSDLSSLSDYPFYNVQHSYHWASTTIHNATSYAWRVYMVAGFTNNIIKSVDGGCAWPVRSGPIGTLLNLSISKAGTGTGTVTSTSSEINCGSTCTFPYPTGASVTLTAAADSGSTFTGWSVDCTGTSSTCTLTMSAAKNVTATFAIPTPTPTATPTPTPTPTPTSTPTPAPTPVVVNDDKGNPVTITVSTTATLSSIGATTTPDTNGLNLSTGNSGRLPIGTLTFTLTNVQPGVDTLVTFTLPQTVNVNRVFKYGPTSTNTTSHWYDFTCNNSVSNKPCGEINAVQGQKVVTLHMTDGALGDNDLTVNGTITDPVAFVLASTIVPTINEYGTIILMALSSLVLMRRLRVSHKP
ncbi:secreted protein containing DUF1566 [Candidatus Magnetobacterium bavaricum]|uniref:Secreted protein containing DUF1566 n=1 Tax=Candidatus Magnetobacterium bavaricum TaxID=29290 RepID=A0A0F3GHG3_9BACT|nr:secreted protein containing DUF1566 [Candidatus Magnetobacterium bavaricum]